MTRISSLLVATTLVILPISAFAQQPAAATKDAAPPTGVTSTSPATTPPATAPGANKATVTDKSAVSDKSTVAAKTTAASNTSSSNTANLTQPAKPGVKTTAPAAKPEVHSMNTVHQHHSKSSVSAKTGEPTKS
jgi:hypothetical protein